MGAGASEQGSSEPPGQAADDGPRADPRRGRQRKHKERARPLALFMDELAEKADVVAKTHQLYTKGAMANDASLRTILKIAQGDEVLSAKKFRSSLIVASAYLKAQADGVKALVDGAGGRFLGVKRSWDEATSRVYASGMQHYDFLVKQLQVQIIHYHYYYSCPSAYLY